VYTLNATNTSHVESHSNTNVTQNENWNVTGSLTNQRYEVYQSCNQRQDNFTGSGQRSSAYTAADDDWNFDECDCHPINGRRAGEVNDQLDGEESCGENHRQSVVNPDDDLNKRINAQVQKTISDILSEAINRCISTSLHGCIDVE